MAISHTERWGSRRGSTSVDSATEMDYEYTISGSDVIADMVAYIAAQVPQYRTDPADVTVNLVRNRLTWERLATECWMFVYTYITLDRYDEIKQPDTGDYRIRFATTGGTAHITTSKSMVAQFPAATVVATQTIGETVEGKVAGVTVSVPAFKFSIHYRQPNGTLTNAYLATLKEMTATTNNATFFGHAAGEVLFLGAEGEQAIEADPVIDYSFLAIDNVAGLTIGAITGIAKAGHEYLDIRFEESEDATANKLVKIPKVALVHQVYDVTDFSTLGIGTS